MPKIETKRFLATTAIWLLSITAVPFLVIGGWMGEAIVALERKYL